MLTHNEVVLSDSHRLKTTPSPPFTRRCCDEARRETSDVRVVHSKVVVTTIAVRAEVVVLDRLEFQARQRSLVLQQGEVRWPGWWKTTRLSAPHPLSGAGQVGVAVAAATRHRRHLALMQQRVSHRGRVECLSEKMISQLARCEHVVECRPAAADVALQELLNEPVADNQAGSAAEESGIAGEGGVQEEGALKHLHLHGHMPWPALEMLGQIGPSHRPPMY